MVSGVTMIFVLTLHAIFKTTVFFEDDPSPCLVPSAIGFLVLLAASIVLLNFNILPSIFYKLPFLIQLLFEIIATIIIMEFVMIFIWNRLEFFSYHSLKRLFKESWLTPIYQFGGENLIFSLLMLVAFLILYYTCIVTQLYYNVILKYRYCGLKSLLLPHAKKFCPPCDENESDCECEDESNCDFDCEQECPTDSDSDDTDSDSVNNNC